MHREFIVNNVARIEAHVKRLWGKKAKPEHWSGLNLIDRSKKLDKDAEHLVINSEGSKMTEWGSMADHRHRSSFNQSLDYESPDHPILIFR
ncbi:MAG: hypothetical protein DMF96_10770 [Acidobacteria bacterium]|nr:MAG: hypothetical protein DMF96_10770 [Acidobacteriota bacterium]